MSEYRYTRLCCDRIYKLAIQNPQANHKFNWALQIKDIIKDLEIVKSGTALTLIF